MQEGLSHDRCRHEMIGIDFERLLAVAGGCLELFEVEIGFAAQVPAFGNLRCFLHEYRGQFDSPLIIFVVGRLDDGRHALLLGGRSDAHSKASDAVFC